jgi:hypothetical protein
MKRRKLRIAWSVAWGIVAVLLLALWVRSYFTLDNIVCGGSRGSISGISFRGELEITLFETSGIMSPPAMFSRFDSWPINKTSSVEHNDGNGHPLPSYLGFKFSGWISTSFPSRFMLCVIPYWFPMILCGIIAALPWWLRPSNRFSLRTLLIATTLVAVGLGLIVWAAK